MSLRPLIIGLTLLPGLIFYAVRTPQTPRAFTHQTVDANLGIGYAVTIADMNGDRRPDIIAVNQSEVRWYENPTWTRRTVVQNATPRDNVCIAARDRDGDGRAELALGAFWKPSDTLGSGSVHWLARPANPDSPWQVVDLKAEPTVHRMRWADVDGDGQSELVTAPLHGRGNQGPDFTGAGARILVYRPPVDPAKQPWFREVADDTLHVVHNLWPVQWDRDRAEEILLAAAEGVHLLNCGTDGKWTRTRIVSGDQTAPPNRGCSEIKVGSLPDGRRFLATVEPFHGNQAVVYTQGPGGAWERRVLDNALGEGHGLWCANVDGRKGDEVLVGWRGPDRLSRRVGIAVFSASDAAGARWEKRLIDDNGMACEDLTAGDLDDDGRPEVVASGRATHNLKIYWNRPAPVASHAPSQAAAHSGR